MRQSPQQTFAAIAAIQERERKRRQQRKMQWRQGQQQGKGL